DSCSGLADRWRSGLHEMILEVRRIKNNQTKSKKGPRHTDINSDGMTKPQLAQAGARSAIGPPLSMVAYRLAIRGWFRHIDLSAGAPRPIGECLAKFARIGDKAIPHECDIGEAPLRRLGIARTAGVARNDRNETKVDAVPDRRVDANLCRDSDDRESAQAAI